MQECKYYNDIGMYYLDGRLRQDYGASTVHTGFTVPIYTINTTHGTNKEIISKKYLKK